MRLALIILVCVLLCSMVGAILWARWDYRKEQDEIAACRPEGGTHRPEWIQRLEESTRNVDPVRRQEALVAALAAKWRKTGGEGDLVILEAAQIQLDSMRKRAIGRAMIRPQMLDDRGSN